MLGKILYKTYYQPRGTISKTLKHGIHNTWQIRQGRRAMEEASRKLRQPVHENQPLENLPEFSFLTGKKFWYMTAFCAYSLSKVCEENIRFKFYDDGTLNSSDQDQIKLQFPLSEVVDQNQIKDRLAEVLPESKYPFLHHKRRVYPHIKKLTDVHAGGKGYQLLLDSDMLFWKKPTYMLEWLNVPARPFYILDVESSYHYSFSLMERLTGEKIPERVNVGAIGLQSEDIDWEKLEYWAKTLEEKEGSNYLLEQALSAMLLAGKQCAVAQEVEYIVMPERSRSLRKEGVLHHYVADSKEWYYKEMWKML